MRRPFIPKSAVILFSALAVAAAIGSAGCSSSNPEEPDIPSSPYQSLAVRDNLIFNLELAYNQRNLEAYRKLFDDSGAFQFFFSPTDISNGNVRQTQWGITKELAATGAMFDRNPLSGPAADDIDLDLNYVEGDSTWQPYVPSSHPGETWYDKSVEYQIRVRIGVTTYTQNKVAFALFTARFTEVDGDSVWQIVAWRDDLGASASSAHAANAAGIEGATWGGMKDLFSPPIPYQPLTVRDHLLENLELAYNERDIQGYQALFDDSGVFQFFFSPSDVSQGKVRYSQWDLAMEFATTEVMFDFDPLTVPSADNLDLELNYLEGDSGWQPELPASHPGETWYDKTVDYRLTVQAGQTTYAQNKLITALFTVRFTEVDGDSVWQIVTWRDDLGVFASGAHAASARAVSAADDEGSTWGGIKDLFSPE